MTANAIRAQALKKKIEKQQRERIARSFSKDLDAKCEQIEKRLSEIGSQSEQLTEALETSIEANKKLVDVLLNNLSTEKVKKKNTQQLVRHLERNT